jgi:hypothetical protein
MLERKEVSKNNSAIHTKDISLKYLVFFKKLKLRKGFSINTAKFILPQQSFDLKGSFMSFSKSVVFDETFV